MKAIIISSLQKTKQRYADHKDYPQHPGIYGFFLTLDARLGAFEQNNRLLYIGISKRNLRQRDFATHFTSGKTGSSILRRSLGAVLKIDLQLNAVPRGGISDSKRYDHYKFAASGEERLSQCMLQHIKIGYWVFSEPMNYATLRAYEEEVIAELRPTLDLDRRTRHLNPLADLLTQLRNICKAEAKGIKDNSNNLIS